MSKRDLIGQSFARLTVVAEAPSRTDGASQWVCRCACGAEKTIRAKSLLRGETRSCGCLRRETSRASAHLFQGEDHGMWGTDVYRIWAHIIQRCTNPNRAAYIHYGGRGIRVCDEWRQSFTAFYAHVGPRPSKAYSIDRINNDGHYEPGNVRWATRLEQARNRRRG